MNVLSLFDGMSCGRIALERADIKVDNYYSSEVDKYAIQIADKNYPQDTKNRLGDVRNIKAEDLPKIDLLIGGSPCQSFSFAGKMKGMSTKENIEIYTLNDYLKLKEKGFEFEGQSYLFWEFVRLLRELKPKYFLLENVKMSKKWEKILTQGLEDVIGEKVLPILINSSLVSAQNRERLYWTNIPNISQPEYKNILIQDIIEDTDWESKKIPHNANNIKKLKSLKLEEIACSHLTNSKSFGNSVSLKGKAFTLRTATPNGLVKKLEEGLVYRKFLPIECERLQTVPNNYTEGVSNTQRYKMLGNGWTVDVISHIFKGIK